MEHFTLITAEKITFPDVLHAQRCFSETEEGLAEVNSLFQQVALPLQALNAMQNEPLGKIPSPHTHTDIFPPPFPCDLLIVQKGKRLFQPLFKARPAARPWVESLPHTWCQWIFTTARPSFHSAAGAEPAERDAEDIAA